MPIFEPTAEEWADPHGYMSSKFAEAADIGMQTVWATCRNFSLDMMSLINLLLVCGVLNWVQDCANAREQISANHDILGHVHFHSFLRRRHDYPPARGLAAGLPAQARFSLCPAYSETAAEGC